MILSLVLAAASPAIACDRFIARPVTDIAVDARPIDATALAERPEVLDKPAWMAGRSRHRIGSFIYQGYGISLRSGDPRFSTVRDAALRGDSVTCGYQVDAPSPWNVDARDLASARIGIRPTRAGNTIAPGRTEAERAGALPRLEGYRTLTSWPAHTRHGMFFIGLMTPQSTDDEETLVVAFDGKTGQWTPRILARLKMPFQTISIVPDLHGPDVYLNLAGVDRQENWLKVVLRLQDAAEEALGLEFGTRK